MQNNQILNYDDASLSDSCSTKECSTQNVFHKDYYVSLINTIISTFTILSILYREDLFLFMVLFNIMRKRSTISEYLIIRIIYFVSKSRISLNFWCAKLFTDFVFGCLIFLAVKYSICRYIFTFTMF